MRIYITEDTLEWFYLFIAIVVTFILLSVAIDLPYVDVPDLKDLIHESY